MNIQKININNSKHLRYKPNNLEKYRGSGIIICRSKWEFHFCRWCDINSKVLWWSSEELSIPYFDKITQKSRRYFPDFIMEIEDKNSKRVRYMIEVKPWKETQPPKFHGNIKQKNWIYIQKTWITNVEKWKAAAEFCKKNGLIFKLITENELFGK